MTRRKDPRTTRLPVPAGELPAFTPVPRRCNRHDGWTPQSQRDFIEALLKRGFDLTALQVTRGKC